MPLLVHFHDVHSQLQSSLAELQTRLDAVDVPVGGGTETIRSELHDAQVYKNVPPKFPTGNLDSATTKYACQIPPEKNQIPKSPKNPRKNISYVAAQKVNNVKTE